MIDERYLRLTTFLRQQHDLSNNILHVSAHRLEELCGLSINLTTDSNHTINDCSNACAMAWLLADYVAVDCNHDSQSVTLQYNPDKVEHILISNCQISRRIVMTIGTK